MRAKDRRIGRIVEVSSLAVFDALVAGGARRMVGWRMRDVDLTARTAALLLLDPAGALVLGCALGPEGERHLRDGGAVVFPDVPDVPVDPYRAGLYTPEELYGPVAEDGATGCYEDTLDARVYAWSQSPGGRPDHGVAAALHDAAVLDALDRSIDGQRIVAVMGGHALRRDDPAYRVAAELGRALTRGGATVATGGGPGSMEAVNLGAFLAPAPDDVLDGALDVLAAVPSFRPAVAPWAALAFEVRRNWAGGDGGLGVPTWFYGHEPPNAFADRIAKFLQNSVREATLLARADGGIVFLPGAAGTVQEIFQDACENYYADGPRVAPMVLVGVEHWAVRIPAWPLLRALAADRAMADRVHLVDVPSEAAALLTPPG
jgi:predicted Rossmann-fold nucleotide-binding protein